MTARTASASHAALPVGRYVGLVAGLAVTATSMSSGFIWASRGEIALVYVAGFFAWTGYMSAHYAVTGSFVDDVSATDAGEVDDGSDDGDDTSPPETGAIRRETGSPGSTPVRRVRAELRRLTPDSPLRALGFAIGIAILVAGIAILAWYVRQENFLLGNLGSGMFLGGYVVAHYFDTGTLL